MLLQHETHGAKEHRNPDVLNNLCSYEACMANKEQCDLGFMIAMLLYCIKYLYSVRYLHVQH